MNFFAQAGAGTEVMNMAVSSLSTTINTARTTSSNTSTNQVQEPPSFKKDFAPVGAWLLLVTVCVVLMKVFCRCP